MVEDVGVQLEALFEKELFLLNLENDFSGVLFLQNDVSGPLQVVDFLEDHFVSEGVFGPPVEEGESAEGEQIEEPVEQILQLEFLGQKDSLVVFLELLSAHVVELLARRLRTFGPESLLDDFVQPFSLVEAVLGLVGDVLLERLFGLRGGKVVWDFGLLSSSFLRRISEGGCVLLFLFFSRRKVFVFLVLKI